MLWTSCWQQTKAPTHYSLDHSSASQRASRHPVSISSQISFMKSCTKLWALFARSRLGRDSVNCFCRSWGVRGSSHFAMILKGCGVPREASAPSSDTCQLSDYNCKSSGEGIQNWIRATTWTAILSRTRVWKVKLICLLPFFCVNTRPILSFCCYIRRGQQATERDFC